MYNDWSPETNDLAQFTKRLVDLHNPDTVPSYSRILRQPTERGVRLFLEVQGCGVLVLEASGSDSATGKMDWSACAAITKEQLLFD
jgi:hypothetical protein